MVELQAKVKVRLTESVEDENGEQRQVKRIVDTTVGRALLSEILPKGLPFELVNKAMGKRAISGLVDACYRRVGLKETVIFADQVMYMAFVSPPVPASRSA